MTRTRSWLAAATATAAAGLALAGTPAYATPDKNCADYPTRAAAQADFDAHGGSKTNNWMGLDNDHDGHVCEHHQFPGQPTPPPNPGPSGCAVCPPSPKPPVVKPPVKPSPAVPPAPEPPVHGGPGEGAEPPEQLPVTGSREALSIAGFGLGVLILGAGLVGIARHRRRKA